MLKEGVKGTQEIMVTEENTAKVMGSGALDVFATPAMIALMEKTAWEFSLIHIYFTLFSGTPDTTFPGGGSGKSGGSRRVSGGLHGGGL